MLRPNYIITLSILALLVAVFQDTGEASNDDAAGRYFPTRHGLIWRYRSTGKGMLQGTSAEVSVISRGTKTFGKQTAILFESGETKEYYIVSKTSVVKIGDEQIMNGQRVVRRYTQTILKAPVTVGASWEDKYEYEIITTPTNPVRLPSIRTISVTMRESVVVPAGTFDAYVVDTKETNAHGVTHLRLWIASGVGQVKAIFSFSDGSSQSFGFEMELLSIKQPKQHKH